MGERRNPVFVPDRLAVTVSLTLLTLAAASWLASYYLMPPMASGSGMMSSGVAGIASSLSISSVGFFEIVWVIGMAAMMFPAMIPIIIFYDRVATKKQSNPFLAKVVGTPLFLGGYLIMYAALGLGVYLAVYEGVTLSMGFTALSTLSIPVSSVILMLTGVYQLTPLKSRSLSKCVSPFGFFAVHFRNGLVGSLRMGLRHGIYCVGCCWAYMLVMLAIGAMSIPVMAVLAGVIALEKMIVKGAVWFSRLIAGSFIAMGVSVLIFPGVISLM